MKQLRRMGVTKNERKLGERAIKKRFQKDRINDEVTLRFFNELLYIQYLIQQPS